MKHLTITLAALVVAALAGSAAAGDLSGTYTIKKGVQPDGKKYGGTVEVTLGQPGADGAPDVYTLTWKAPDGAALYQGTGWSDGKLLWAAFGTAGVQPGQLDFQGATADGLPSVEGFFDGLDATPVPLFNAIDLPRGKWKAGESRVTDDLNNELGSLTVAKLGKAFALTWTLGTRQVRGVGIPSGKKLLAAAIAGDGDFGVVVYKVKSKGKKLDGTWAQWGAAKAGVENLAR